MSDISDLETPESCMVSVAKSLLAFATEAGKRGDSRTCLALTAASRACDEAAGVIQTLTRERDEARRVIAVMYTGAYVVHCVDGSRRGWEIAFEDDPDPKVVDALRPIWTTHYSTESEAWAAAWTALRAEGLVEEVSDAK